MNSDLGFRVKNEKAAGRFPVIYIHGAMGNKLIWNLLSAGLAAANKDRAHYAIDLPGHGDSQGDSCTDIESYSGAVIGFLDHHKIEKATFIGHSMGGATAQMVAITAPARVESLIMMATGARLGVAPGLIETLRSNFELAMTQVSAFAFGPGASAALVDPAVEQMKQAGPEVAADDFTACGKFDAVDRISGLNIPAIVFGGEKDMLTPPKLNRQLAQSLGCEYVEYENAGHMLPMERPKEMAPIITDLLNSAGE